jgi:cbb3-type cytochrome oxidase subunit 3
MFREYIASTGLGGLHLIAMVVFFVVFLAVLLHTFLDRDGERRMARAARLPFEDGESPAPGAGGKGAAS